MNKKYLVSLVGIALIISLWFSYSSSDQNPGRSIVQEPTTPELELPDTQWTFAKVAATQPKTQNLSPEEIVFTAAIKEQMADISDAFEENMRYPTYSKPLSKNNWTLLNPRAFVPKAMPLAGLKNTSVEIVIPRFIVTRDESFPVTVKVISSGSDAPQVESIQLRMSKKEVELPLKSASSSQALSEFSTFVNASLLKTIEESDVIIRADIVFDNAKQAKVSSLFKLVGNEAVLEDLSRAYVEGADLVIPANFSVEIAGHYRIQANLFDKQTLEPISHLNNTFTLASGSDTGLLKVHAETLRSKGFAGPYILKDFNITRSPAAPSEPTGYGTSKHEYFEVQGFDLDSYSREKYQDKHSQQRLEFLQKMAGIEE